MDTLELAILSLYGVDKGIKQSDAHEYCEKFKASGDCWRYCIEKLGNTNLLEVKFFCVNVLIERIKELRSEDMIHVRNAVYEYVEKKLAFIEEDPCVVNKIVQLYLCLLECLYPQDMKDAFHFLISLSTTSTDARVKMKQTGFLLSVLKEMDQEYLNRTNSSGNQNFINQLKEHMKQNDLNMIVECLYYISTLKMEEQSSMALSILADYVCWIDINYVVNEKFLGFVYPLLTSQNEMTIACMQFLMALVKKGMNPLNKIHLIETLNLVSVFKTLPNVTDLSVPANMQFLISKGNLLNHICINLQESLYEIMKLPDFTTQMGKYTEVCSKSMNMLLYFLPITIDFFVINDKLLPTLVEPCLSLLFTKHKNIIESSCNIGDMNVNKSINKIPLEKMNTYVSTLMYATVNQFEFPVHMEQVHEEDEQEEEYLNFMKFREIMEKFYQRLIMFDRMKAMEIVTNAVLYLNEHLDNMKWNEIESKLFAFLVTTTLFTESIKSNIRNNSSNNEQEINATNVNGVVSNRINELKNEMESLESIQKKCNECLFERLIELLKKQKILNCNNNRINKCLMEIFQKLHPFFLKYPEYVECALHVFLTNGFRSQNKAVFASTTQIFKKFSKSNISVLIKYLKDILPLLNPFLEIPFIDSNTEPNEELTLYIQQLEYSEPKDRYNPRCGSKIFLFEELIDMYEIVGMLLLLNDGVKGRKTTVELNANPNVEGSHVNTASTMESMEATNAEVLKHYEERIIAFKNYLNKLLQNIAYIKKTYVSTTKESVKLAYTFLSSVCIKCIGSLCKAVNFGLSSVILPLLNNTLELIFSDALELFHFDYLVRESVLYTYRIFSSWFRDISINYTAKLLPYLYNISYNMILSKIGSSKEMKTLGNVYTGMNLKNNGRSEAVSSLGDEYRMIVEDDHESLKYLFNELNELSVLVCYVISTYRTKCVENFINPHISDIIQIHMNIWKKIRVESREMQREQNVIFSPLLLILYNISLAIPSTLHAVITTNHLVLTHIEFATVYATDEAVKNQFTGALTSILLIALNYENTRDFNITLCASQVFSNLLNYTAGTPEASDLIARYPLMQIIQSLCLSLKTMDYHDGKHKKLLVEILKIFRLFCGFKITTQCFPKKLTDNTQVLLQNGLFAVYKNTDANQINLLLQAISINNQEQFRQILVSLNK